jgi:dipeptide transport system ATP-binding protein
VTPVLETRHVVRDYHVGGGVFGKARVIRAVKDASLKVEKGKTLAIVGESGSGKSTLARILTLIDAPTAGELFIEGEQVDIRRHGVGKALRRKVQMVFQNPYGSLNPRQKIGDVLSEPLVINTSMPASERHDRAHEMLKKVGLGPEHFNRYPHMFSGGQRQRIAIARALMLNPSLLVLDEPVSALDLSVQAQIIELLRKLQREKGLSYLFISHDLKVVRALCHRVIVMQNGQIVEQGPVEEVLSNPKTDYASRLIRAAFEIAA